MLSNISIHNLNTTYPNGDIHLQNELELLEKADRIVCQFPLFWFSTPTIMKEWQDKRNLALLPQLGRGIKLLWTSRIYLDTLLHLSIMLLRILTMMQKKPIVFIKPM